MKRAIAAQMVMLFNVVVATAVPFLQNNFKQLFNNSLCSYTDCVFESAMNSTLITFINCTFSKIIMTVFILIKHYTTSMANVLVSNTLTLWH